MDRKPADGVPSDVALVDLPAGRLDHETPYRRPPVQLPELNAAPAEGTTGSSWFGGLASAGAGYEDGTMHDDSRAYEENRAYDDTRGYGASARPGAEEPAQRAEAAEPKYGPAPPATSGRTSFGFSAGPISPVRSASGSEPPARPAFGPARSTPGPVSPARPAFGPVSPAQPATGPVSPAWSGAEAAVPGAEATWSGAEATWSDAEAALPGARATWSGAEVVESTWTASPQPTAAPLSLEPVRHADLPIRSVPMTGTGLDSGAGAKSRRGGTGEFAAVKGGRHGGTGELRAVKGGRHGGTGEFGAVRVERAEPVVNPRTLPPAPPRQPRFVTVGMIVLSVIVLAAGTVIGIVYFSGNDQSLGNMLSLGHSSSTNSDAAAAARTVTAPLGNRSNASFEMLAGANTVHLSIGELGDSLYKISTPEDAGIKPSPVVHNDDVQLQVTKDGDGTGGEIQVVLAAKVRWQLRFSGYAEEQVIDVSGGQVSGIELVAGMHKAELDLGKPSGTVPVKITGAVDQLVLRSPDGCPMRVSLGGGAKAVVAGSRTLSDMRAGSTLTPKDWAVQKDNRYDVTTASAIASLNVENLVQ